MAYDLISRSLSPSNFARPATPPSPRSFILGILELCIAGTALALPEIVRQRENYMIRKEFSTDFPLPVQGSRKGKRITYAERRLKTTLEVPAVPMRDLVFNRPQST